MARIEGMERRRTLVARLAFFLSRRSYGRVITPARVYALDSRLLLAVGLMEEVQEWAKQTRVPVKHLARMLVAWRIGCPWCLDFGTSTSQKHSSSTMIRLAQVRLARFGSRVQVWQTDGPLRFEAASGFSDRFVSTYVADLLLLWKEQSSINQKEEEPCHQSC